MSKLQEKKDLNKVPTTRSTAAAVYIASEPLIEICSQNGAHWFGTSVKLVIVYSDYCQVAYFLRKRNVNTDYLNLFRIY